MPYRGVPYSVLDARYLNLSDGFANPTASIGLTTVDGVATTAMRSDGAPSIDQGIVPTWTSIHTFQNTGLHILDTGGDHDLILKPGTDLGADRTLTLTTGDADRTITLSGNPTLDDWLDQSVKVAASPTFVSMTLSETTTAVTGVIFKGAVRFIHNFQHPTGGGAVPVGQNTFVGVNAGNFTTGSTATETFHASRNVGVGQSALELNTIGYDNMAMGRSALQFNTEGYQNTAMGTAALAASTTGFNNIAVGYNSLILNIGGKWNVAIGSFALQNNTEGIRNVAIGHNTGSGITTGDNNTFLGGFITGLAANLSGSVFVGFQAGSNETVDNKLYIANSNTTTPLIHGLFSGAGAGVTIHSQNAAGVPLIVKGIASQASNLQEWQKSDGQVYLQVQAAGHLEFDDAVNVVFDTTTGTKIGTATSQKLGFWNKAPIVQLAKADYNNWAAFGDVVNALVAVGLFDAA